jgi:hypothetical protein
MFIQLHYCCLDYELNGIICIFQASIIVGLTTVKGYGDFLNMGPEQQMAMDDDKHGADSCQFTLFQSIGTKVCDPFYLGVFKVKFESNYFQKVGAKLSDPEVAQLLLNPARLGHFKGATHFIQTVYYGCAVVCVFKLLQPETDEAKQNVDIERVKQVGSRHSQKLYKLQNYLTLRKINFPIRSSSNS